VASSSSTSSWEIARREEEIILSPLREEQRQTEGKRQTKGFYCSPE
jgi:hypothetical protein